MKIKVRNSKFRSEAGIEEVHTVRSGDRKCILNQNDVEYGCRKTQAEEPNGYTKPRIVRYKFNHLQACASNYKLECD